MGTVPIAIPVTVELCPLKKLCKTCATAETPNACSHAMWQRAWTTTKKQLEETGSFDKDWANTSTSGPKCFEKCERNPWNYLLLKSI